MSTTTSVNQMVHLSIPLEEWMQVLMLTPMDNPIDPDCIKGVPFMLHGPPGVGKTSRVRQTAHSLGLMLEAVELGGKQPEDASGAPFLRKNAQGIEEIFIGCTIPAINELNNVGMGVLFLDELPNARPATQGAFLSLVQERRIGSIRMAPGIRIVAAGNPPGESAGSFMLSPPMANRFAHRDMGPPTAEEFEEFLMSDGNKKMQNMHTMEATIVEKWGDFWPTAKGQLRGFTDVNPKHIYDLPKIGNVARGKAFTTPRSIYVATRAITVARIMGLDASKQEDIFTSVAGAVGGAWSAWVQANDLPSPEMVIREGWEVDKRRLDIVSAILMSVVSYTTSRTTTAAKHKAAIGAWKYVTQVLRASLADLSLRASTELVKAGLNSRASEEIAQASQECMRRFVDLDANKFV